MKRFLVLCAVIAVASTRPAELKEKHEFPHIISQEFEVNPDGSYVNNFETSDGTKKSEHAVMKKIGDHDVQVVEGAVEWTDDTGKLISMTYTADEKGYVAYGDHIPTVPPAIVKSLKYNEEHPWVEDEKHVETFKRQ